MQRHGNHGALADVPVVDWLFKIGMLGVGLAVITGAGMRIAAIAGTLIMLGMWAAEWPLAQLSDAGEATSSTNPLIATTSSTPSS